MAEPKHVHKLRRHTFKTGNPVFFCTLPDCKYKTATALALGKRALCWRCGEPFIMNEYSVRLAKPHCEKCHKPKTESMSMEEIKTVEKEIKEIERFVPAQPKPTANTLNDLRSRLTGIVHGNLAGKPDNEEDI